MPRHVAVDRVHTPRPPRTGDATAHSFRWQAEHNGLLAQTAITGIAGNPHLPRQIVASSSGVVGLYFSNDGGATWRKGVAPADSWPVFALHFDRNQRDRLWLATVDGLYLATPGALASDAPWRRAAAWPTGVAAFALHQMSDGRMLAGGAHPAVWQREEGTGWQALTPLHDDVGAILSVASGADGVLLAGTDGHGLFVSRDEGASWQLAPEIGETFVAALWVAPWNEGLILARTRAGLFRSTDGATSWQQIGDELDDRIDAILGLADEAAIYLGMSSGRLYRSVDEGASWQRWGDGLGRDGLFHALWAGPTDAIRAESCTRSAWLAGTQHRLYRSVDCGQSWTPLAAVGGFQALSLVQSNDGVLYLGNGDGVFRSVDDGVAWQAQASGLPPRAVLGLAVAPDDADRLYAATEGDGVYVSEDGGGEWTQLAWDDFIIPDIAVDPHRPERLFVRMAFERIYASDDGGETWGARWEGKTEITEIMSFALAPHQPDLLYAGGAVDAYRSENGGITWQRMAAELDGQSVFMLEVDANDPDIVYAGATKGLYRSVDGGASWARWGSGLEEITVTALAFHPANPQVVWAGTKYRGVFASDDGGATWQPANDGLVNSGRNSYSDSSTSDSVVSLGDKTVSIHQLLVDDDGQWLFAAGDRGFWRAPIGYENNR